MTNGAKELSREAAIPGPSSNLETPTLLDRKEAAGLLALGLLMAGGSLLIRVINRGPYYYGWEVLGAAQGHFLASTRSIWGAVSEAFSQTRNPLLPTTVFSVPLSLIPGYLERLWPWEYWAQVLTFSSFMVTLGLILRVAEIPLRQGGILLLAWSASPMLLSYSVAGSPYAASFLPHALALWITMSPRIRTRWVLTLLWCLVANELSWHVYELGKTVFVVFFASALLTRDVALPTRAIWLLAGAIQLTEVVFIHPSADVQAFAFQRGSWWETVGPSLTALAGGLRGVVESIFIRDGRRVDPADLPILFAAGILSFFFFRRHRWLLLLLLLVQVGLFVLLGMYGTEIRPRRFIMVSCSCLVSVAFMYREAAPLPRRALVGLLLVGGLWQGIDLFRFVQVPFPPTGYGFTMPYMYGREGVGLVDFQAVDWSRQLRANVEAGERLLLVYNFDCYAENLTNPTGVLERLYLSLGHERFTRSVFVFGSESCRYCCLPIRPLADFGPFLDGIRPEGPMPPATLTAYVDQQCNVLRSAVKEPEMMFATIRQRFRIRPESLYTARFFRFKIEGPLNDLPIRTSGRS
jgi:hypothetical protein